MYKFGSTGLLTGYIKQMLASFNLPQLRIYTREHEEYFIKHGKERSDILESYLLGQSTDNKQSTIIYIPYLKGGRIQIFVDGEWQGVGQETEQPHWHSYSRGEFILNHTKRFKITNNIYDTYTHEYLGNYLRFLRDFDDLNLMPLYNCFSKACAKTALNLTVKNTAINKYISTFNANDENYTIYSVPVKFFQKYTIAIDSESPVEFCCGLQELTDVSTTASNKNFLYTQLAFLTYKKFSNLKFNSPVLYTGLLDFSGVDEFFNTVPEVNLSQRNEYLRQLIHRERDLRLYIKVSKAVDSSIVVLEGDYRGWNDWVLADAKTVKKEVNHTIISNENLLTEETFPLITTLQLLKFNTRQQTPFADRLIEYLLENCITGQDSEPLGNIKVAQEIVARKFLNAATVSSEYLDKGVVPYSYVNSNGIWNPANKKIFYSFMSNLKDSEANHDILGYIDKDVEKYFYAQMPNGKIISLLNAELEEDFK